MEVENHGHLILDENEEHGHPIKHLYHFQNDSRQCMSRAFYKLLCQSQIARVRSEGPSAPAPPLFRFDRTGGVQGSVPIFGGTTWRSSG